MPTVIEREQKQRVDVRCVELSTNQELRELGAFVRFCVGRIERELGIIQRWLVSIAPMPTGGYVSTVTTSRGGRLVEASGTGPDVTQAAWIALGLLEHHLRELAAQLPV